MGIIAEENDTVGLDLKVETTVNTAIGLHAVFQLLRRTTVELCHRHSSDTILNVNRNWLPQLHILDALNGRDKIEGNLSVLDAYVLCVEIALCETVVITAYTFLEIFFHLEITMDNQCPT